MPHKASVTQAWEAEHSRKSGLAFRRLLISVLSMFFAVGIRRFVSTPDAVVGWAAWLLSAVLAIVACVFAAEVVFRTQAPRKHENTSLVLFLAKVVMWFAIFWIGYLAMIVFFKIAFPVE